MATLPTIASLVARWVADDLTDPHATAVPAWVDRVAGMTLASAGSRQPLLYKGVNGINGHSVLRFDGVNDHLSMPSQAAINRETLTVYVLVKFNSLAASKVIIGKQDVGTVTPGNYRPAIISGLMRRRCQPSPACDAEFGP